MLLEKHSTGSHHLKIPGHLGTFLRHRFVSNSDHIRQQQCEIQIRSNSTIASLSSAGHTRQSRCVDTSNTTRSAMGSYVHLFNGL